MVVTYDPDGDLVLVLTQETELEDTDEGENSEESTEPEPGPRDYLEKNVLTNEATAVREDVHMLVSSKHMSLASPVFKAMLQANHFKEGRELASAGKVEISLPDDDPDAFAILMCIIHGRTRSVPREIDLDLLSRISTLVDKYQLHEVVEIMSDRWISQLESELPEELTDDLLPWLSIAWVFEKSSIFKEITRIAERQSKGRIGEDRDDIPIPNRVLDAIQERRLAAITDAYFIVETILHTGKHHCTAPRKSSFECSGMVLGTLLQSSTKLGIFPVPDLTNTDLTFNYVANQIRKVAVVALCDSLSPFKGFEYHHWSTHGVKQAIDTELVNLEKRLCGLEMEDFKKGKRAQAKLNFPVRVKTKSNNLDMTQLLSLMPSGDNDFPEIGF
ncbi:9e92c67b-038d-4675-a036-19ccf4c8f26d [Sclerotinia trifoliorum]|uniref:9e92c67b-038d-4675-a036-19ccf4c8f26d n=1 Tax=Sclerotinia trifoliorum TaxID=28548 RepID=A0A8H2VUS6_9HELO|nr:9e92c67b-038d-4675-a036-19ccf4c8f26d [Sclerotinia trifoliorum]